jgi:hypothetical protein
VQRSVSTIPYKQWKYEPRVIRVILDNDGIAGWDVDSITWNVNIQAVGPLRPGTIVIWRDLYISHVVSVGGGFGFQLEGLGLESYNVGGVNDGKDFEVYAITRSTTPAIYEFSGTAPLAATLRSPEQGLMGRRVVLRRALNPATAFNGTQAIRVGLMIIEPGANFL